MTVIDMSTYNIDSITCNVLSQLIVATYVWKAISVFTFMIACQWINEKIKSKLYNMRDRERCLKRRAI